MDDDLLLGEMPRGSGVLGLTLEVNPKFHDRERSQQNKEIHAVYACNKVHGPRNGHRHKRKESGKIPSTHEYLQPLSVVLHVASYHSRCSVRS